MKFRLLMFSMAALLIASFAFTSGVCREDTTLVLRTLVAPVAFADTHAYPWGNGFPWDNDTFYFATFRNQYLYPAHEFPSEARTVQSVSARSTTFTGSVTSLYEDRGFAWNYQQIIGYYGGHPNFTTNFLANRTAGSPQLLVDYETGGGSNPPYGTPVYDPIFSITTSGSGGISHGHKHFVPIIWDAAPANNPDLMMDCGQDLTASGHSGNSVWDMAQGQDADRAYGTSSYWNRQWLTTAWGVDDMAFVWVFRGMSGPPAATLDANIKEIVRLLLTPEALRCSDLDTNPDRAIHDDPIMFPGGKDIDPVSPQVTSDAPLKMEEESNPSGRKRDFRP